jgi:multidrug resistance efflux pump
LQDLRTQAAMAEAALNSAQFNWSYAAIVAPRDGTVLRRLAEEREVVAAGAPVLVLGAQDRGFVVRARVSPTARSCRSGIGDAVHVRSSTRCPKRRSTAQ